jgi:hypothetical protein
LIRNPVIEQFPFTIHFCLPREFVLKMELALMLADGFNDVSFHLAVGFVAATTTRGGNCDHTAVASKSVAMATKRDRLFCGLFI